MQFDHELLKKSSYDNKQLPLVGLFYANGNYDQMSEKYWNIVKSLQVKYDCKVHILHKRDENSEEFTDDTVQLVFSIVVSNKNINLKSVNSFINKNVSELNTKLKSLKNAGFSICNVKIGYNVVGLQLANSGIQNEFKKIRRTEDYFHVELDLLHSLSNDYTNCTDRTDYNDNEWNMMMTEDLYINEVHGIMKDIDMKLTGRVGLSTSLSKNYRKNRNRLTFNIDDNNTRAVNRIYGDSIKRVNREHRTSVVASRIYYIIYDQDKSTDKGFCDYDDMDNELIESDWDVYEDTVSTERIKSHIKDLFKINALIDKFNDST